MPLSVRSNIFLEDEDPRRLRALLKRQPRLRPLVQALVVPSFLGTGSLEEIIQLSPKLLHLSGMQDGGHIGPFKTPTYSLHVDKAMLELLKKTQLRSLRQISICHASFPGSAFNGFKHLRVLEISAGRGAKFSQAKMDKKALPNLERLGYDELTKPCIDFFIALQYVCLSFTPRRGVPDHSRLPRLRELNLGESVSSGYCPLVYAHGQKIQILDTANFTSQALVRMPNVRTLTINSRPHKRCVIFSHPTNYLT